MAGSPITFGSFNRRVKITDEVLATWARILTATPTARLLLKDSAFGDIEACRRVTATLGGQGVAPDRIEMRGRTSRIEHLAAMSEVDIALDTFPQNGGLTTYESILMGVPVIALSGRSAPGRSRAAILSALDLSDWIAADEEAYVALGTAGAADGGRLAVLRATLRQRLLRSAVGDLGRYTRSAEAAFREIWRRWCATGRGRGRGS